MSASVLERRSALVHRVNPLTLAAGDKAIYPGLGPCLIGRIEKRVVDAGVVLFYHLIVLDGSRGELFIPVEKARGIGVRLLMKKSEISKLFAHLQRRAKTADTWKQRASDNSKLLNSGSPFDLAEIVSSLTELSDTRSLTFGESRTLERARKLLVCEISEVMGETTTVAEEQVSQALNQGKRHEESGECGREHTKWIGEHRGASHKLQLVNSTTPMRLGSK